MRRKYNYACALLIITTLLITACAKNQEPSNTGNTSEVEQKLAVSVSEAKLIDAFKTSNFTAMDELMHDNLVFNTPTGQTITKAMDIENMRSGVLHVIEYTPSDQTIAVTGDVGVVSVTIHLKATVAGNPIEGNFRFLRVWKWIDKSWKLVAVSGCPI